MKVRVMICEEREVDVNDAGFDNWVYYLRNERTPNMEISEFLMRTAYEHLEKIVGLPFTNYNNEKTYIYAVYDEEGNAILDY